MLMQTAAQELAPERIRVNAIAPGAIKTSINESVWNDPDKAKKLLELIPYGRIGEVKDVARAALWLASDDSDYVTGDNAVRRRGHELVREFPRQRIARGALMLELSSSATFLSVPCTGMFASSGACGTRARSCEWRWHPPARFSGRPARCNGRAALLMPSPQCGTLRS